MVLQHFLNLRQLIQNGKREEANRIADKESMVFQKCARLKKRYKNSLELPFSLVLSFKYFVRIL